MHQLNHNNPPRIYPHKSCFLSSFTCVSSCEGPGGQTWRRRVHTGDTGTACVRCVCGNDGSAHRSGRISIHSLPSCSGTASHRCEFADEPLNENFLYRFCRSRRRYMCASPCASWAMCAVLSWVWNPAAPGGRTAASASPSAHQAAGPDLHRTCRRRRGGGLGRANACAEPESDA